MWPVAPVLDDCSCQVTQARPAKEHRAEHSPHFWPAQQRGADVLSH